MEYIYDLKKSMARWNESLLDKLKLIGFHPYNKDPDIWMQDSGYHYEYISPPTPTIFFTEIIPLAY